MDSVILIFADVIGLLLIGWIFRLVRRNRLYVGYGVILALAIVFGLFLLSVPPVLIILAPLARTADYAAALIALTLTFVIVMLVYILSQLTLLSNRLTVLVQELAMRNAVAGGRVELHSVESR